MARWLIVALTLTLAACAGEPFSGQIEEVWASDPGTLGERWWVSVRTSDDPPRWTVCQLNGYQEIQEMRWAKDKQARVSGVKSPFYCDVELSR